MPVSLVINNISLVDTSSSPPDLSGPVADTTVHVSAEFRLCPHGSSLVIICYSPSASSLLVTFEEHALVYVSVRGGQLSHTFLIAPVKLTNVDFASFIGLDPRSMLHSVPELTFIQITVLLP